MSPARQHPPAGEPEAAYRRLCCLAEPSPAALPSLPRQHQAVLSLAVSTGYPGAIEHRAEPVDALGKTGWFQSMWPTDTSMPEPKFPHFSVSPLTAADTGVTVRKHRHRDECREALAPVVRLGLDSAGATLPLYAGGPESQIAQRTGNLLCLVDRSAPVARSAEMIVVTPWLVLWRVRVAEAFTMRVEVNCLAASANVTDPTRWVGKNERGFHGVLLVPGNAPGEVSVALAYDLPTEQERDSVLKQARTQLQAFDQLWQTAAAPQDVTTFLTGAEDGPRWNFVAACVNRALRNVRACGSIAWPSMVEFYGPEWDFGDGVWINFLPACRYMLWIAPAAWANSIRTLLAHQQPNGMVPQAVFPKFQYDYSQIPNITPCVRDYYVFTGDRECLEYAFPRFKAWYGWWLTERNPTGDGIISVGSAGQDLYSAICEYKDNGTDPDDPVVFENTCNPLTRTAEIAGRPERAYLPDIVACQARMAEDLAFMAGELGLAEDLAWFAGEYRRVRDWANRQLWDEATRYYYPVGRATGQKVMKRSNAAFWLLWAGIADARQKDALVEAMFDPGQFFTPIPLPMIAVNDPSFNPRCGHWGDGYVWPIDVFHAFDGLLRYGEWDRAAQLAERFNTGVFAAVGETLQPAEFYHHSGRPCGCPIMGTAGCVSLVFQRYCRDHQRGLASQEWSRFAHAR